MAVVGSFLLATNVVGVARGLRSPELDRSLATFARNLTIAPSVAKRQAGRRRAESDSAYIQRITDLVHRSMTHYWPVTGPPRLNQRVPLSANFLLRGAAGLRPDIYERYEFLAPDLAVERGIGLCSQFALAIHGYLTRAGISSHIVGLGGHVVVEATTNTGDRFVADADYGVVLPHAIADLEAKPALALPAYSSVRLANTAADTIDAHTIARLYDAAGNGPRTTARTYAGNRAVWYVERLAIVTKWLFPLALLVGAAFLKRSSSI